MLKRIKQITLGSLKSLGLFSLVGRSHWRQEQLLILAYHGISLADEHRWDPDLYMHPDYFRERLQLLKKWGCRVLPLEEAVQRLYDDDLPRNSVVLTFDDGYYDFYRQAHPILREFNYPATVYVTTTYVDFNRPVFDSVCGYLLWQGRNSTLDLSAVIGQGERLELSANGARSAAYDRIVKFARRMNLSLAERDELAAKLARQLKIDYDDLAARRILHLMTPAELAQLAADGVDIQLHTHRHRLPKQREAFIGDLTENHDRLRSMTHTSPHHLCYPSGIFDEAFFPWLEELGVRSATTCEPGFASIATNPLLLPRLVDSTQLAPIEFEAWLSGIGAKLPRRRGVYNFGVAELEERDFVSVHG